MRTYFSSDVEKGSTRTVHYTGEYYVNRRNGYVFIKETETNFASIVDFARSESAQEKEEKPKQPDIWKRKYKKSLPKWKR